MHAGTGFTVTVDVEDDTVLLRVADGSAHLPVVGELGLERAHGRGLGIVAALSDAWGVTPEPGGGKSVWASIPTTHAGWRSETGAGSAAVGEQRAVEQLGHLLAQQRVRDVRPEDRGLRVHRPPVDEVVRRPAGGPTPGRRPEARTRCR